MEQQDLLGRIGDAYKKMSKGQKRIADYITNNYDKAAFMTACKLGECASVSESTVVRFADALGFDGYPELQKTLQELIRNKLTTVQRIELASDMDEITVLKTVLKSDMNNIRMTIDKINEEQFQEAVESLDGARKVYILGLRSSAPLTQFIGYYLNFVLQNVHVCTPGVSDIFEQLMPATSQDVVIGVSFPRYSTRTLEGVQFAKKRGVKVIAITDSTSSRIAECADIVLTAQSDMASFVDSFVAPLSLVNALIVAIGLRRREDISKKFQELENIWREYNVYIERQATKEEQRT
ncbi:MAG: MurR/RpiR family transcriptional regulator [Bacillota bacterium]|nr:MurR/RpiR family transcriptional regulator [Bacillota bacterium]